MDSLPNKFELFKTAEVSENIKIIGLNHPNFRYKLEASENNLTL